MALKTLEILESLMTEHRMTPAQLDDLIAKTVHEDLYLDYKRGCVFDDRKKGSAILRRYISGFANSEGGVLIIGVDADNWKVTGCPAPGGGDLAAWSGDVAEWASDCLTPIAAHFSQRPEFSVVDHTAGKVLVAWTARSLNLVPCNVEGKEVYYFRFHEKTLPAEDYLIRDLMLGRRSHPYLHLIACTLESLQARDKEVQGHWVKDLEFIPKLTIENQSLSWAQDVRWGIIGWDRKSTVPLSQYLRWNIVVQQPRIRGYPSRCSLYHLGHSKLKGPGLTPFAIETLEVRSNFTIPCAVDGNFCLPYAWRAAVYIVSSGSPPVWYQLSLLVCSELLEYSQTNHSLSSGSDFLEIERVPSRRPLVACETTPHQAQT